MEICIECYNHAPDDKSQWTLATFKAGIAFKSGSGTSRRTDWKMKLLCTHHALVELLTTKPNAGQQAFHAVRVRTGAVDEDSSIEELLQTITELGRITSPE